MEGNPTKSIFSRYAKGGIDAMVSSGVSVFLKMSTSVSVTFVLKIMNCGLDVSSDSSWEALSCCQECLCCECVMCNCDAEAERSSPSSCAWEFRLRLSAVWVHDGELCLSVDCVLAFKCIQCCYDLCAFNNCTLGLVGWLVCVCRDDRFRWCFALSLCLLSCSCKGHVCLIIMSASVY
jgi:hypothetical protein